jgi:hypothetical protein
MSDTRRELRAITLRALLALRHRQPVEHVHVHILIECLQRGFGGVVAGRA